MQIAQEYLKSKEWEAAARATEIEVLKRKERHAEIMEEARLMRELGEPPADILFYVRSEKAKLE